MLLQYLESNAAFVECQKAWGITPQQTRQSFMVLNLNDECLSGVHDVEFISHGDWQGIVIHEDIQRLGISINQFSIEAFNFNFEAASGCLTVYDNVRQIGFSLTKMPL